MSASRGIGRGALPFALFPVLALAQSVRAPLGGLTALYPWPEEPRNLVKNPSFESRDRADVPEGQLSPLEMVAELVARANEVVEGSRPVWQ